MATNSGDESTSGVHTAVLTPSDIPGAELSEPYEAHAVPALKWWLLCRGIKAPSSWKKAQLIDRIHTAVREKEAVIDVDGSYMYRKHKQLADSGLTVAALPLPLPPLTGWESVSQETVIEIAKKVPHVASGVVYAYLASGAGRSAGRGTFRALTRGFIHWQSGRIENLEVNVNHPLYCHVRSTMKPSMKAGSYHVGVLLGRDGEVVSSVLAATCECAAGKSASCTHVSALLQALVAMTPVAFQLQPGNRSLSEEDEDNLPVTSYACQWKPPKKRKESNLQIVEAVFKKHTYGVASKQVVKAVEDFDPRPVKYRGTANQRLPNFLDKIRGEQLCVSLLLDPSFCQCNENYEQSAESTSSQVTPALPNASELKETIAAFKASLNVMEDVIRKIEQSTRAQRQSLHWFNARRYRLTASLFGLVLQRRDTTPPNKLVLRIIQPRQINAPAIEWGIQQESVAVKEYIKYQNSHEHEELLVAASGFLVSHLHPFLGATPDGAVFDPSSPEHPFGFLEVKCPFAHRNITAVEACGTSGFYCTLQCGLDGSQQVVLSEKHPYFAQVQGQMAIGNRPWCDFVVFTLKGISVSRIEFNSDYWNNTLLPKLVSFYDSCVAPEIVSPLHSLGMPMRNLSHVK